MRGLEELCTLSLEARYDAVTEYLRRSAASGLEMEPNEINLDGICPDPRPIFDLIRPRLMLDLGVPIYDCDLPYCTSLRLLAEHLTQELEPPRVPSGTMVNLYEGCSWAWGPVERAFESPPNRAAVFVLSAPRSGSTLLRAMLSRHPRLFAPPELHLLPFGSMKERRLLFERLGYTWMGHGLLSAMRELEHLTPREAERRISAMEETNTPVSELYARIQELARDRILVDKSPTYAFHPAWLSSAESAFHDAYYIHLVRHPNATIESFVRMRFQRLFGRHWLVWDDNAWLYGEKCWTSSNLHILNFLREVAPTRQLTISFEDLVARPAETGSSICNFLQIPFNVSLLSPYGAAGSIRDYDEKGPAIGDPNFLRHSRIESSMGLKWKVVQPPQPLGYTTREVARRLNYSS